MTGIKTRPSLNTVAVSGLILASLEITVIVQIISSPAATSADAA